MRRIGQLHVRTLDHLNAPRQGPYVSSLCHTEAGRRLECERKTPVQGLDQGGFDRGTGVQRAGSREDDGILRCSITALLLDDEVPDCGALPVGRESPSHGRKG